LNKSSSLLKIDLQNTQTLQFTTKLNWKLYTKVIKKPSEEALVLDRQSVLIKREAQVLLI
jgi:hypothetical protein